MPILLHFGNKPFLCHEAPCFPSYALLNAHDSEETPFKKTVTAVSLHDVPPNANSIGTHFIYKVKSVDNTVLSLKARITPHGNEDIIKGELGSDCEMCSHVLMRILSSTESLFGRPLHKLDVKAAFQQTGQTTRNVYVGPTRESADRARSQCLLLTAAYGMVNTKTKCQVQSDALLHGLDFESAPLVPQLFFLFSLEANRRTKFQDRRRHCTLPLRLSFYPSFIPSMPDFHSAPFSMAPGIFFTLASTFCRVMTPILQLMLTTHSCPSHPCLSLVFVDANS